VIEAERTADFELDLVAAKGAIATAGPAITFLCSPNNPTGIVETEASVRAIATWAPGLTVVDEAYGQFSPWSALTLIDEETPLVVTRTFSKTWSMAAARLGYLIGPSWLVAELDKVVLPYHLDVLKQIAGRLALRFTDDMNDRVEHVVSERRRIEAELSALGQEVFPSGANFVLFRVQSDALSGHDVWTGLVERSVLIRDCTTWPRLDGCLRVTVGTPDENSEFLAALAAVLADPARPTIGDVAISGVHT
jgi:histidinol-phosphate aminotransferase